MKNRKKSLSDVFYYLTLAFGLTVIGLWVILTLLKIFI